MNKIIALLISGLISFSACNNTGNTKDGNKQYPAFETLPEVPLSDGKIILKAGDDMKFNPTVIRVREGQIVKLILHHTGNSPKTLMGHNFVLLKAGVSLDRFMTKALEAEANDYIPKDNSEIIAHTRLLGGGESDSIEFSAPAKGSYQFFCSFPGHAMSMNGKFVVE